jgi:hypothetical protein
MTTSQRTPSFVMTTTDTWDRASPGPASGDYPRAHEQDLSAFNFLGEDPWITTYSFPSVTQPSQWHEDALSAQKTYSPQCGPSMYPAPQTPGEQNATRLSRLTETLLCFQPTSNPSSPGWPGAYLGPSNTPSFASPVEDALGLHSDGEYDSSSPHTPSPRSEGGHHDFDNSEYNFGASPVVGRRSPTNYPFGYLSRVEEPQLLQQAGTPQIHPKQKVFEASRHLRVPAPGQVETRVRGTSDFRGRTSICPRSHAIPVVHTTKHTAPAHLTLRLLSLPPIRVYSRLFACLPSAEPHVDRFSQSRPRRASEGAHKAAARPASRGPGAWIPQAKYRLPVTEDTEEIFKPEPPILFCSNVPGDAGVSLNDLLTTGPKICLANCHELPFQSSHVSVCFRLEVSCVSWAVIPPQHA